MSAFVVGHDHIDALLSFAIMHRVRYRAGEEGRSVEITQRNASEVGAILLHENERSVGYRYGETDPDEMPGTIGETSATYRFRDFLEPLPALAALKACDCLEYQSCEHPGWGTSLAAAIVDAIRRYAIARLPGYSEAPGWEWTRTAPAPRSASPQLNIDW